MEEALRIIYPEYPWEGWKFGEAGRVASAYWRDVANQRQFLDAIGKRLYVDRVKVTIKRHHNINHKQSTDGRLVSRVSGRDREAGRQADARSIPTWQFLRSVEGHLS